MAIRHGQMTHIEFRRALGTLGMTQTDFAEFIGKRVQAINLYANGHQPIPLVVYLLLLAMTRYGIGPSALDSLLRIEPQTAKYDYRKRVLNYDEELDG